jgi:hypothetical protein
MTAIVLILIGLFCIPFFFAEVDRKWDWHSPECWRDLILGLVGLGIGAALFL